MNKQLISRIGVGALGALALCLTASGALASHPDIPLRNEAGAVLLAGSTEPYSPKQTCDFCHDNYDTITQGYHFTQGFDELIADADRLAGEKPFIKTPGMYGKW